MARDEPLADAGRSPPGYRRLLQNALRAALDRVRVRELEDKHRKGYARKPVRKREFSVWEREQVWGD